MKRALQLIAGIILNIGAVCFSLVALAALGVVGGAFTVRDMLLDKLHLEH